MRNDLKSILKSHWGYENFRPKQQEIIESILKNKDTQSKINNDVDEFNSQL